MEHQSIHSCWRVVLAERGTVESVAAEGDIMSRLVNPVGAAATAVRQAANRRVVNKVLQRSSERSCEQEFMRLMMALPQNPQEEGDEKKFVEFQAAQKSLDACIKDAIGNNREEFVNMKMKQLSEIAATKKRRRRNGIGRGRWNLERVY